MKKQEQLEIINYLDTLVSEGNKISIGWDGGGDSGWCWFAINDKQVSESSENNYIRTLLDYMYSELDYGSWAGEFHASGEAIYSVEEKAFVGIDHYSEDSNVDCPCSIKICIPKDLWFDSIEINIEDDDPIVNAAFHIRNGFLSKEHTEFISKFVVNLKEKVEVIINEYTSNPENDEYRSIFENFTIDHNEFEEQGDFLVFELDNLSIGTYQNFPKTICLNVKEIKTIEYDKE
jgi:hypothetical protein